MIAALGSTRLKLWVSTLPFWEVLIRAEQTPSLAQPSTVASSSGRFSTSTATVSPFFRPMEAR